MTWLHELVFPDFALLLRVEELVHSCRSQHQLIEVYRTARFGLVLVLDGAIQLTQGDNYIYHEMLAHVPLLGHGCVSDVLIVGGGDGGTLREVLKHPVKSVRLVELDPDVMEVSRQYFRDVSDNAFDDTRVEIVFQDAAEHLKITDCEFDIILVDSTDPVGPGQSLFTSEFYGDCRRLLRRDGAIVVQGGSPVSLDLPARAGSDAFGAAFGEPEEYLGTIPSYPMGMLTFRGKTLGGWRLACDPTTLERRVRQMRLKTHHYSPSVHRAAFEIFPRASRRRCEDIALRSEFAAAEKKLLF